MAASQRPLLHHSLGRHLLAKKFVLDPSIVDRTNDILALMLDLANADVSGIRDERTHVAVDRLDQPMARLRPTSYLFHTRCWRSLDLPIQIRGFSGKKTIRERIFGETRTLRPDSDRYSCKFGVGGVIVATGGGRPPEMLVTRRADSLAYYPGTRHLSFSGGIDTVDLSGNVSSLATVVRRGAARECFEELNMKIPTERFEPLGLWYDMERLSVQSMVLLRMNRDEEEVSPSPGAEVGSWSWEAVGGAPSGGTGDDDGTPELRLARSILRQHRF